MVIISNFDAGDFSQTLENDGHNSNDKRVKEDFSRKAHRKEKQPLEKDGKSLNYIYYRRELVLSSKVQKEIFSKNLSGSHFFFRNNHINYIK